MNYSITHIWEKRNTPINQDALAYSVLKASHSTFVFAIVADGIGSFQSSELASSYICNRLNAAFKQIVNSNPNASMRFYRNALSRTIFKIHKKLLNFNQDHNLPLGSTCSLIFIKNNRGFTLHYGDSRIYYNNRLLTTDHIDNKGRLVRCIGYGAFHTPQYSSVLIRPASTVTLCTDGYYKRNPHDNSTAIRINVSSTDNYILRRKQKNEH